jgi:cytochrome c biogenesis protein CcmG, thiol:disulfide interchange protein DsbE
MSIVRMGGLGLLLAVTACATAEAPGLPRIGEPAPDYAAATLEGDTVSLSSLRGKVVLLNLWATWCAPCRRETPFLESLHESHEGDDFRIVGISMDTGDAADQVAMFVKEFGVQYTILHDPQMRGMELYQVLGLPATFLIDRDGTLRWMRYGPVSETDTDFMTAVADALR